MELLILLVLFVAREFFLHRERAQAAAERERLLQRIQAPEVAVASYATGEDLVAPNPVPAQSDEEMWELINGR